MSNWNLQEWVWTMNSAWLIQPGMKQSGWNHIPSMLRFIFSRGSLHDTWQRQSVVTFKCSEMSQHLQEGLAGNLQCTGVNLSTVNQNPVPSTSQTSQEFIRPIIFFEGKNCTNGQLAKHWPKTSQPTRCQSKAHKSRSVIVVVQVWQNSEEFLSFHTGKI